MKIWRQEDWAEAGISAEKNAERAKAGESERRRSSAGSWENSRKSGSDEVHSEADEMKKAREKAVYYLQFSGKTESELRKKLAEQEFSPASVDSAIEFVKKYRYLDDEDYARRFVEKNRNRKSQKQMMYELAQKGVERAIVERTFEDMDVDEEAQILKLLEKRKYPKEDVSREEKQKISAYLARKGFSYDAISSALIQYARKN